MTMTKRIQKLVAAVAALAALALGGAVFAQAQSPPSAAPEPTTAPDRDNIQSGDQTTPDAPKAATARHHARRHAVRVSNTTPTDPAGGGSGQSGNQSTPDSGSASETPGTENPETGAGSESAPGNDGPGGHADEPGNANADHQFQGNE
jgi:hypothetical protein